jgi:hypothetical protein
MKRNISKMMVKNPISALVVKHSTFTRDMTYKPIAGVQLLRADWSPCLWFPIKGGSMANVGSTTYI